MAKLDLTLACWDYDRVRALKDGSVRPEDIELKILTARPVQIFDRMLATQEFHVSEMGLASYVTLKARDRCPFAAIPVFISRMFRHGGIFVNTDAGIETPQDLKGKRVGLSRYVSTTAVFVRGMLQHDYGVRPRDVHWISGSQEEDQKNRPRQRDRDLPLDIRLDPVPEGKSLSGMLEAGELDALLAIHLPSSFLRGSSKVKRLFPDYKEAELDYYRRTRIFPIMHTVVIREDVYREHPWVAASLYKAFCEAKELAIRQLYDTDALSVTLPFLIHHIEQAQEMLGTDFWPYGVEPSRPTLEAITQYVVEQGLAPRKLQVDELFAQIS